MKSLFFMTLVLLTIQVGWGQIKGGEIIYKVEVIENHKDSLKIDDQDAMDFVTRYVNKVNKNMPFLEFLLKFNENESIFKMEEAMGSDSGIDLNKTASFAGGRGVFYTNLTSSLVVRQFDELEKEWLLQIPFKEREWKIENEFRTIHGYKCQKASTITRPNGYMVEALTVAWFTVELPFQFGPVDAVGLPGMILGFERNGYYFYADKIELSKKEIKIQKPDRGTILTREERYENIKEAMELERSRGRNRR